MNTPIDCIPCFLRQVIDSMRLCRCTADDEARIIREVLFRSASFDYRCSPPVLSGVLQAQLRKSTRCVDPFFEAKKQFNRLALELLPPLARLIPQANDPFAAAVRLAIAGNVIDLGAKSGLSEQRVRELAAAALDQPVVGELSALQRAAGGARRILYLCDNAGEIVFDRVLIQQLPRGRVTVAVRGQAVLNDATREDAVAAGLSEIAELIDNGSDIPGTCLADCSTEFRRRFYEADLVLAKGQGNFETLHTEPVPLFCLFRVKCNVVANHCGYPVGSHVIWHASAQAHSGDFVS